MYCSCFISSSVDRHLGCVYFLAVVKSAAMNTGYMCLLELWFSQGICPVVELLGRIVVLFLVFKEITTLSSIVHTCVLSCFSRVQLCVTLPGSSVHGILQARILECHPVLQGILSSCPPGNLPGPGIELASLMSPALAGRCSTISATWEVPFSLVAVFI